MGTPYRAEDVARAFPELELQRGLGSGGQASTFLVESEGEESALKVFFPGTEFARVEHEIAKLGRISSEHVVRLKDHGTVELGGQECRYVLLDYVAGQPLADCQLPLGEPDLARLVCDVTAAIRAFRDVDLVHRDLTPANIMVDDSGKHVVIDLSLAKHADRTTVTAQGMTVGTPGYMSPEQAAARQHLTYRSDIYSLGVTAYVMATGAHPFSGAQPTITSTHKSLVDLGVVSAELAVLLDRMLSGRAYLRPTLSDLEDFCGGLA